MTLAAVHLAAVEIIMLRHIFNFPRLEPPASCRIVHCPTGGRVHNVRGLQGSSPGRGEIHGCITHYLVAILSFSTAPGWTRGNNSYSGGLNQSSGHDSRGSLWLNTYSEPYNVVHREKKAGLSHQLRHMPTSLLFAKMGGNLQRSDVYLIYKSGDIEGAGASAKIVRDQP